MKAHRSVQQLVLVQFIFLVSLSARASVAEYYTVNEKAPRIEEVSLDPLETLSEIADEVEDQAKNFPDLNLLNWFRHPEALPEPTTPYNRLEKFGTWIRERNDGTCFNTRAKVLARSSEVPVTVAPHGCAVVAGRWQDPYSNRQYTNANDIQIDHVVPLKNTYVSGAWKWDKQKRCLYANFMGNDYHLLAVNGPDNMKKGDRTPEKFMPSNPAFSCQYLSIWLKIKLIWNLAMIPSEAQAITQLVQQNHCDTHLLEMTSQDLQKQRQTILDDMNICRP